MAENENDLWDFELPALLVLLLLLVLLFMLVGVVGVVGLLAVLLEVFELANVSGGGFKSRNELESSSTTAGMLAT